MEMIEDFKKNVLNGKFEVNQLGSSQYSNISNMIDFIQRYKSDNYPFNRIMKELNIKVKFSKIENFSTVKKQLLSKTSNIDDPKYKIEIITKLTKVKSFYNLFKMLKNMSRDLWSSAENISNITFKNLKIKCDFKPTTYGPILNKEAQSEGIVNAIQLYLFYEYKLIKDFDCLKDFDT
jgi:hypothetical protein